MDNQSIPADPALDNLFRELALHHPEIGPGDNRAALLKAVIEERSLFDSGPLVVIKWAPPDGERWPTLFVSKSVTANFGFQPADFCGPESDYRQFIHPDDLAGVEAGIMQAFRHNDRYYELRYRLRCQSGEWRWILDCTVPVFDATGRLVYALGYLLNIDERQRLLEQIRESEELLRILLDSSHDQAALLDAEGRILAVNEAICQFIGLSAEALIGKDALAFVPIEVRDLRRQMLMQVIASRQAVRYNGYYHGRSLDIRLNPILNNRGEVTKLAVFIQDISERLKAEEGQLKTARVMEGISKAIPGAVYRMALNARHEVSFLFLSPAVENLLGWQAQWLIQDSHCFATAMEKSDWAAWLEAGTKAARDQGNWDSVFPFRHASGKLLWLRANAALESTEPTGTTIWNGVLTDVSELVNARQALKEAKEAAEAANRSKSTFLEMIGHEIRTPLNAIVGFAALMPDENSAEARTEFSGHISENTDRLLSLIDEILDYAKLSSERLPPEGAVFSPSAVIEQVCLGFQARAHSSTVQFDWTFEDGFPETVGGHPVLLRDAFRRLLDFLHNTCGQGRLILTGQAHPRPPLETPGWELFFLFHGPAMPAYETMREWVDRLTVGIDGPAFDTPGLGLGLAIGRIAVERMGGRLFIERDAIGLARLGFTITVAMHSSVVEPARPSFPRVLVFASREEDRLRMEDAGERAGLALLAVGDPERFLAAWSSGRWPSVLLEWKGLESPGQILLEQLRSNTSLRNVSIAGLLPALVDVNLLPASEFDFDRWFIMPVAATDLREWATAQHDQADLGG